MNEIGKSIATVGIWTTVAATAYFAGGSAALAVGICAVFGTAIVWDR